jgi:hypothetical protein
MFADNKKKAIEIGIELSQDGYIGQQDIIYRKYEPLVELEKGLYNLPFSNEWRFFFYGNKLVSVGFYWSNALEAESINSRGCPQKAIDLAFEIAEICQDYANFYVLDIAQKQDGSWILVEVNDAQMSGLSMNNEDVLYNNLKLALNI